MLIDGHNHIGADLLFYLRSYFPYAQDWPTLLDQGGREGVTHWVVFPMVSYSALDFGGLLDGQIRYPGSVRGVPYALENRRMLTELFKLFPKQQARALPLLMVDPLRDTAAQVKELRALRREYRFHGLKIQATITQAPIKSLLREGRCLLEFAAEENLPWLIHSSVGSKDPWSQASDILDIAEAWPQLRFCLAHSCRYDLPCLERLAALPNAWFDCSAHVIHCDLAVRNQSFIAEPSRRFHSHYEDPAQVLLDLAQAWPDKLIWGSDSPFYSYVDSEFFLISTYATEAACLKRLPAPLHRRVTCDNVLAFLQLSHESLLAL